MANDINRLIDMIYERIEDAKAPALKPRSCWPPGRNLWRTPSGTWSA